jgi:hypothetical protein
VFENRVLRRICGPEKDKVTGELRKLHNAELNDLCSPIIIRGDQTLQNEMGGACSMYGVRRGEYKVLVGKYE